MGANGRPTKLNPEVQEKICNAIKLGCTVENAATIAGVHRTSLMNWLKRGVNAKTGRYFSFFIALKEAKAHSEAALLTQIRTAAQKEWTAAAWILERRFPERYAKKDKIDITVQRLVEDLVAKVNPELEDVFDELDTGDGAPGSTGRPAIGEGGGSPQEDNPTETEKERDTPLS